MVNNMEVVCFDLKNQSGAEVVADDFLRDGMAKDRVYWIHCDLDNKSQLNRLLSMLHVGDEFKSYIDDVGAISRFNEDEVSLALKLQVPSHIDTVKIKHTKFGSLLIYLTGQYCLTLSRGSLPALVIFKQTYTRSLRYAMSPCFILFLLLDNVLNELAEIIFSLEMLSDEMDQKIRVSHQNHYQRVTKIKYQALKTTRYASALRDILMRISGRKITVVTEACRKSLSDLFNHAHVIVNEVESVNEVLNGLLSQIDNALMHRMSEAMKVLTGIATIFLPLTLITGIYGMNFKHMPELDWEYGYFSVVAMLIFLGVGMYIYFKSKKWM